jgi:hypothetical protein
MTCQQIAERQKRSAYVQFCIGTRITERSKNYSSFEIESLFYFQENTDIYQYMPRPLSPEEILLQPFESDYSKEIAL